MSEAVMSEAVTLWRGDECRRLSPEPLSPEPLSCPTFDPVILGEWYGNE